MSRLIIALSEARYRARSDALELVRRARARSKLNDKEALAVAQEQIKTVRRRR